MNVNINAFNSDCSRKAYLDTLSLGQHDANAQKSKAETLALKKVVESALTSGTGRINTRDSLVSELDRSLYMADWQYTAVVNDYVALLDRFFAWPDWGDYEIISGRFSQDISFGNVMSNVSGDFILRHHGDRHIIMCKLSRKDTKLSSRAQKEENKPQNSFVLGGLFKAGLIMFPGNIIETALFCLKGKNESASDINPEYDWKPEKNIVRHFFSFDEIATLDSKAEEIASRMSLRNSIDCRANKKCEKCDYYAFCSAMLARETVDFGTTPQKTKVPMTAPPTEEQQRAIDADEGIFVVNAAAGCGKTFVLVKRIVRLIQKGVPAQKILAITFTNKAAEELRTRVKEMCEDLGISIDVKNLRIYTFNGFGATLIKEYAPLLGYDSSTLSIAETIDSYEIILELLNRPDIDPTLFQNIQRVDLKHPTLDFMNKKGIIPFLWEWFDKIKTEEIKSSVDLEVELDKSGLPVFTTAQAKLIFRLFGEYNAALKERNMIEYQDQINLVFDLFALYPEIKKRYSFAHIMIDEYQDTAPSNVHLITELLTNGFVSLMCVGDDAQAIYHFRHADYTNLLNVANDYSAFGEVHSLEITKNFRSTEEILALGNAINHSHQEGTYHEKELRGRGIHGPIPDFNFYPSEVEEMTAAVMRIQELHNSGVAYNDVAVIGRNRGELLKIQSFLEDAYIPCTLRLSEHLIDNPYALAIKCLADVLSDTDNRFSFLTELSLSEDIDPLLDLQPDDLFQVVDNKIKILDFPEDLEERLVFFYNYCDTHFGSKSPAALKMMNKIKERNFADFGELNAYLNTLFDYKDSASLEDIIPEDAEAVSLITAHSAKGKEWKHVILIMDQFANKTRNSDSLDIGDETRLFFVAATRAKETLSLYQFNTKTHRFIDFVENAVERRLWSNGRRIE